MMRARELRPWLVLALTLAGCPADDGTGGTHEGTTSEASGTTGAATLQTTAAMTSGMSGESSTGEPPADCDPPCDAGEACVEGTCMGASDSTGEPVTCGTTFTTRDPACDECWQANCCTALQACHGDETVMASTPCTELDACINESCLDAMDFRSLETCVDESCPGLVDELGVWFGLNLCVFTNCAKTCSGGA